MFPKISAILIVGVIADERTCPEPWTGKWGKKFKKSFRDFFKFPDHKGTDFLFGSHVSRIRLYRGPRVMLKFRS